VRGAGTDPLLLGLAAGEERAFEALYDRFAARMYRAALSILGSREDAEDAVQEVFLAMVRSQEGLVYVRDLTAYLFASLRRAAIHRAQQRSRAIAAAHAAANEAPALVSPASPDDALSSRLERAIRSLPDEQREVVTLKIDGELTFAQIAQVMGIGISTAASRYRYAMQKLRTALGDVCSLVERAG
jgi:RNA polymerase sigma-70 factor, ECF subfamily